MFAKFKSFLKKTAHFLKPKKLKKLPIILLFLFLLAAAGAGVFMYFFVFYKLPSPTILRDYKAIPLSTHIYDRNGKLLYEVYKDQNRTPVKLKDLPKYVSQATISIEDKDFYKHGGVSLISGVLRAVRDMILQHNLQGGSTLTQQLVKGALLTPERSIQRKMKEIILAVWTEKLFSKDQILEMYVNQVPYGGSSYGIEAASKTYFSKKAKDLTLDEAALLAGLPQAPSLYSPYTNPDLAENRRNDVLDRMYEYKYITKAQLDKAKKAKISVIPPHISIKAPHFVFYVKSQLEKIYGTREIEEGGMRVYTTLDLDIQMEAEKILKEELEKVKKLDVSNGAVLVTRPPTGEILAMLGSVDYFATGSGAFNVATALRQPGSSIKPLNYAVGIDRKIVNPATVFLDTPTCFSPAGQPKKYCPVNYDGQFHGPVQLRFALGNSLNIPAVKMLGLNGVREFVASSSAFTITTFTDPDRYGLSLTLGGAEVRMTEMAQAFSAFANQGRAKPLNDILQINDKNGKTIYKFQDKNFVKDVKKELKAPNTLSIDGKRAVSAETAYLISHILLDNNARSMAFGPSSFLVVPKHAVSVKTGTTDDKKDNWTIGYTPNFLTAVWVGNNDNTPMNPYLSSGVTGAAPIWNRVMKELLKNQPDLWPIKPENVVGSQVCNDTGLLASKNPDGTQSCASRFEYFIKGTEGKQVSQPQRAQIPVTKDSDKQAGSPSDPNVEMKEKTIIKDPWSTYCLDCAHDPTPTPH
ncbi:MAG: hypothetical protein RI947_1372 [Candidatus Parcubacteria bacterium]|jgi:penicillin-binding protein 1C